MIRKGKKVLYFCSSSVFGGAERFIETAVRHDENSAIYFLNSGHFSERCKDQGFDVYHSNNKVRLSNPFSWLRFQFEFHTFLKKSDFTHVHLTMAYSQIFASVASRLTGLKTVWFQHGPIGGVIDKVASKLPYDFMIFNSEYTRKLHIDVCGEIKSPFKILRLATDSNIDKIEVNRIKSEYSSKRILLSMGRITRFKCFDVVIKAMVSCQNSILLILGKPSTDDDKAYLKELVSLVDKLSLSESVKFLGFKENTFDYLAASEVFIHSSQYPEPFGLVVAEAISAGTFVLAPRLGGVIDQVKPGINGDFYNSIEELQSKLSGSVEVLDDSSSSYGVEDMMNEINSTYI